eukprot:298487-Rhodomonas_salina.1
MCIRDRCMGLGGGVHVLQPPRGGILCSSPSFFTLQRSILGRYARYCQTEHAPGSFDLLGLVGGGRGRLSLFEKAGDE